MIRCDDLQDDCGALRTLKVRSRKRSACQCFELLPARRKSNSPLLITISALRIFMPRTRLVKLHNQNAPVAVRPPRCPRLNVARFPAQGSTIVERRVKPPRRIESGPFNVGLRPTMRLRRLVQNADFEQMPEPPRQECFASGQSIPGVLATPLEHSSSVRRDFHRIAGLVVAESEIAETRGLPILLPGSWT